MGFARFAVILRALVLILCLGYTAMAQTPLDINPDEGHIQLSVGKALEFIMELNESSEKAAGYKSIYELLESRNELNSSMLVNLACFVRDDFVEGNPEFESLKEKFPLGIQSVIWSEIVRIESKNFPGYTLYGSNPGNIYTYPSDNYAGGKNQMWEVEREKSGGSCYFRFNNVQNYGVLHDGGTYAENHDRIVGRGILRDKQFWDTVPQSNGFVSIRNKGTGRYLDAGVLEPCKASRLCCCSSVLMAPSNSGNKKSWKIY